VKWLESSFVVGKSNGVNDAVNLGIFFRDVFSQFYDLVILFDI